MFDEDPNDNEQTFPCAKCEDGGVCCDPHTGDWVCENCGHNYSLRAGKEKTQYVSNLPQKAEPDGYAVLLADKNSAPQGFWFVVSYHDKATADDVANRQGRGAYVRPFRFVEGAAADDRT